MNSSLLLPPLKDSDVKISELIIAEPSNREYLFNEHLVTGIVGAIVAVGGTGKSYLVVTLSLALATGQDLGPLKPSKKFKVLYLAGEDPLEELHKRIFHTAQAFFGTNLPQELAENFYARSVVGEVGPLLKSDRQGNLTHSQDYNWLDTTLSNLSDVEVLIIDPLSKFFGLDENNNSHCAWWIASLEALARKHNLTILFTHHESKARTGDMTQTSSRGGSALTDGCRWVVNLRNISSTMANKFGINQKDYIEFDITKNNYSPKLITSIYFQRNSQGVLKYVNIKAHRTIFIAIELLTLLDDDINNGICYSKRDLLFSTSASQIIDTLRSKIHGFVRSTDIDNAVKLALSEGWLIEEQQSKSGKGKPKTILRVISIP